MDAYGVAPRRLGGDTRSSHVKADPDDYYCDACGAEQCPVCRQWFNDYDALTDHTDDIGD